ncbi:hypothetical protein F4678DRAFT_20062 [Xylaria arbuscula]|nr:hypothetical protein F4678DRAFT_20062 [Xylaria arbuscula]
MGSKTKNTVATDNAEEPLPNHIRKKSTGTINLLIETRRQASDDYLRAQRAEKAYRMRKNATIARTNLRETKTHFREGFEHLGKGIQGLLAVIRAAPYLVGERQEIWRRKSQAKKRVRAEDMRKKLDEKLSRKYAPAEGDLEESGEIEREKSETGGGSAKGGKK